MKVLLVQPPFTILKTEEKACHPPLGLAYIAASLKKEHQVIILDALAEGYEQERDLKGDFLAYGLGFEVIKQRIKDYSPDIIGVSSLFSTQFANVQKICQIAKEVNQRIITIVGGAHPSAVPSEVLKNIDIDYAVIGEGEFSTKALLRQIEDGGDISSIQGIAYKTDGEIIVKPRVKYQEDLDEIPFPYWDIFPLERYFKINLPHGGRPKRSPFLPVITSRGCPLKCIFCSIHTVWGRAYRTRSPKNVLSEIDQLISRFKIKEIIFEDDNITFDRKRSEEIFKGMAEKKFPITWTVPNGISVDKLDKEILSLMKRSGCYSLSLAVESGDEDVLREIIRKPVNLSKVKPLVEMAKSLRLKTVIFFVVGLPGEKRIQLEHTFTFARYLGADSINFFFAIPLPGTELLRVCQEKKLLPQEVDYSAFRADRPSFATQVFSKDELQRMVNMEKIKIHFTSLIRSPMKFILKIINKLIFDFHFFSRYRLRYSKSVDKTGKVYGFIWARIERKILPERWHFHDMQEVIPESIVRGKTGIDVGSGCGYDVYFMARDNRRVNIVGLDISDGVYQAKGFTSRLENAWIVKGSALDIPAQDGAFDFAYSYGVLHHTPRPEQGLKEIARVLKAEAPVFLYLYEAHQQNYLKYLGVAIVRILRKVTTRLPSKLLYILSSLASPFVVIFFAYPARILNRFKLTRNISQKIPFNFATGLFSVTGDLYDRLSAPIEHRFNKDEVAVLLERAGFADIHIDKFKAKAGWLAWGRKQRC
jgi:magnesium-protoporphyrin IX monomethyl ester (oxidative) cyclase